MAEHIIPALATIVVAVIEAIAARERKRARTRDKDMQQRSEQRAKESRLSMAMMSATLKLSIVTANALTGGHNNGNVEAAREAAEAAETEYQAFLQRVAAAEIAR